MSEYQGYKEQIKELEIKAEAARKAEIEAIVADIKQDMAKYGITVSDLGGKRIAKTKVAGIAKYRDPDSGKTWTGKGRRPEWVIRAGDGIESLRVA